MVTKQRTPALLVLTGIVIALMGLALVIGGALLGRLGGSLAYLGLGLGLLVTAGLLLARRRAALWLYAAIVLATTAWAVWEIGLNWWALVPRGDVIFPIGLWLLLPVVRRGLAPSVPARRTRIDGGALALGASLAVAGVVAIAALIHTPDDLAGDLPGIARAATQLADADGAKTDLQGAASAQPDGDWWAYGRTGYGLRYSPLRQLTPANVGALTVAWTFRTGDRQTAQDSGETTFEVTPLKVRDTVYLCSQHQILFALDAASGALKWKFDPEVRDNPTFQHLTCRGVSYHESSADAAALCARRIYLPTNDARLFALDAATGARCEGFGDNGVVDLNAGMPVKTSGFYEPTSPPAVSAHVIVVNGAVIDNYSTDEPSGVVRGYDTDTGKLLWAWDSGAEDENALPTDSRDYTKNSPNSWITASIDEKLGLVYLPMGVQTPDIWGGHRDKLAERYASAIVALDINTGHRVWSYQTVHHDLWDMDVPSQPSLVDVPTASGTIPAIYVPTKTGNLFVLDRRDGKLIVPAPEQTVPQGAAPGDWTSPTQPFSDLTVRPSALLTGADMWGATIFDQLVCRIQFHQLDYRGTFTPPSERGTLVFPGNLGMFEWGGIAVDPVRQIAIANPIALPFVSKLIPRGPNNPAAPNAAHPSGSEIGVQPMYGTPYGVDLHAFLSPIGLPCKRPPWGYMAGIDLKTNKVIWMHKNGTIRDSSPLPLSFRMGVPSLGGPLVTAGGVAFLTGTQDDYIRAYDVTSGAQIWSDRLPAGGQSTPMSYEADGRQFILTADGGHGSFGTKQGDYVIAYALPKAP
ncbi:quinoprotein glucose dehydrogenase [Endobacter medicaginis]|uniref:Quinoprotein glucose dehydrogenase n=3 Tax=Endobacter medicaginis TaxID=1181271 RepID=A0A839V2J3_9PROT|nr:membrane-bound PQQ-dependent dehydrogenase, glucose/quinate/shikimate family [Endobacter medicaginis]MBB3174720.1 quinoprotein glucose dehydrogenase [Endobacter medicaginis]MCX5474885.1 membrane-bound PQQ-dependent dehydrogenase, glucose/quinate/shikimate family [Endobacter medicaginis]